jgi:hypothetical protein
MMRAAIIALWFLISGCVTISISQQSGEKNTVKSDQDQSPSTPVSATVLPLK